MSTAFHSVGHEVATYEDVVKLLPDPNRRRPIILIGKRLYTCTCINQFNRHTCMC